MARQAPWSIRPGILPPDENRGQGVVVASWVLISVAVVIVSLRLYARLRLRSSYGWDDACILISTSLSIAGSIGNSIQVYYGFGRHVWYLSDFENGQNYKWLVICQLLNFFSLFFTRTSICLFALRILKSAKPVFEPVIYGALFLNFIATFVTIITYSVQCIPLQGVWDLSVPAQCFNPDLLVVVLRMFGSLGCITDAATVAIPLVSLLSLQLDRKSKQALCMLLGFGLCTAAFAVGKAATVQGSPDQSWVAIPTEYCALFEENLGIIVACLPALHQLSCSLKIGQRIHFPYRFRRNIDIESGDSFYKDSAFRGEKGPVTVHVDTASSNESLVNIFTILKATPSTDFHPVSPADSTQLSFPLFPIEKRDEILAPTVYKLTIGRPASPKTENTGSEGP